MPRKDPKRSSPSAKIPNDWKQRCGRAGEAQAGEFLRGKGFQILEQNYRTRFGEIDLIAQLSQVVYFIEVKTRSAGDFGDPLMAITPKKIQHLQKAAWIYLLENPDILKNFNCEFAAIAVRPYETHEAIEMVSILPKTRF